MALGKIPTLMICLVLSVIVNLFLEFNVYPHFTGPLRVVVVFMGRAAAGVLWISYYQSWTGERGLNPLATVAIAILTPAVASRLAANLMPVDG